MSLTLMYITNRPQIARIAQASGVDRVFVDMEYIDKDSRQAGLDTVKSHHTFLDIENINNVLDRKKTKLQVRVNPIHDATADYCSSEEEIESAIGCGADIIMLPMFKGTKEVERFLDAVNGRAKTILLLETKEAHENIEEIIKVSGFDEVHIGLNDLHLAYKKKFMFEFYIDGVLDNLSRLFIENGIRFGIGGIARVGYGMLPAEYIIAEHYRLGSQMAILSRSFCDANKISDTEVIEALFAKGISDIREFEKKASGFSSMEYAKNHAETARIINEIITK